MFLLLGDRAWVAGIVLALALWGYAAYRFVFQQAGLGTVVAAAAGSAILVLAVRRSRRPTSRGGPSEDGDTW
jgi:hypothetical protein